MDPKQIWEEALKAAQDASQSAIPVPMVVGTPTTMFGNDIDRSKPMFYESEGLCGFAWVRIKPARGKFVKYLKDNKIGSTDDYLGGYTIWMGNQEAGLTQSIDRKEAAAQAMKQVFKSYDIKCCAESRLD